MPPQKNSTTNNIGNTPASSFEKETSEKFAEMKKVENLAIEKSPEKNKLERLENTLLSKDPFEMFSQQRKIVQNSTVTPKILDTDKTIPTESRRESGNSDYKVNSLRTYRGDVEQSIQNKKTSVVHIALAEKKRRQERGESTEIKRDLPQNTLAIILSTILVIAGIGSLFIFLYAKYEQDKAVVILYEQTIIPADISEQLILTSETVEENIFSIKENLQTSREKEGSIVYFDLIQKREGENTPLSITELLSIIAPSIPSHLERSFENEYMLGSYISEESNPFLLIKTNSYETAFSGMLEWEETLAHELGPLFIEGIRIPQETRKESLFQDRIIKNKDARVVKDEDGDTLFLYSFLDKETILITTKEDVLVEILRRYLNSKLIR